MRHRDAPQITDRRLFASDGDPAHVVRIGPASPDWYIYASGYKAAGDVLVGRLNASRAVAEVCLPILFVYRHAVELFLKALLIDLGELHDVAGPTPDGHHLAPLWGQVHSRLLAYGGHSWLERAGSLIGELDQLDPCSFTFRYPATKTGVKTVAAPLSINMRHLRAVMGELYSILDGIAGLLAENLSIKRDFEEDDYYTC